MTTQTAPAPWLVDHLVHTGVMTETGLTRRARPRPCPHCSTWVITGLDADTLALEAACDPQPLNTLGEAMALVAGRRTLNLTRTRGRLELEQRWADHVESQPAGTGRADVLAEHVCGQPIPASWNTTSRFKPTPGTNPPPGSPPPF